MEENRLKITNEEKNKLEKKVSKEIATLIIMTAIGIVLLIIGISMFGNMTEPIECDGPNSDDACGWANVLLLPLRGMGTILFMIIPIAIFLVIIVKYFKYKKHKQVLKEINQGNTVLNTYNEPQNILTENVEVKTKIKRKQTLIKLIIIIGVVICFIFNLKIKNQTLVIVFNCIFLLAITISIICIYNSQKKDEKELYRKNNNINYQINEENNYETNSNLNTSGILDIYKKYLKNILNFKGRTTRNTYIIIMIPYIIINILLYSIFPNNIANIITSIIALLNLSLMVRRLHDSDTSMAYLLIVLIPIIGAILLFIKLFIEPSDNSALNKYGPII